MRVVDVEVSPNALYELALRLAGLDETELAGRVAAAIDSDREYLPLNPHERATVLHALVTPPDELAELRHALLNDWGHGARR